MGLPWNDYGGRLSPLKLAVFVALFVPGRLGGARLWLRAARRPAVERGDPSDRAVGDPADLPGAGGDPLRQILQWPQLILVRRMIGVGAFAYVLVHFTLYAASLAFDLGKLASEIVLRIYLTIGFVALLGLAALAATSTDGMVRRLGGRRWQLLHRLVYAIGVLAVVHYCFQSKLELWEPAIMAGLLFWLLGYRLLLWRFGVRGHLALPWVAGLGLAAPLATALGEAAYFRLAFHAPLMRVLDTNLSLVTGIRPAVIVLAMGLAITAAGALRTALIPAEQRRAGGAARRRLTPSR